MNKEKTKFLLDNIKLSVKELAEKLNMAESTIFAEKNKLGYGRKPIWTEEKIKILKESYPVDDIETVMKKLDFYNLGSIRTKAHQLNIKVLGFYYTKEEIEFIKNNIYKLSYQEIADTLGKTIDAIATKANRIGIIKSRRWLNDEIELLKKVYPDYSNEYISKKYFPNRTAININSMGCSLGLHKSTEQNNKQYNKEEMIFGLNELAIKLGRTPKQEDLVKNNLPSSKTYERYFDGYRNACRIAGLPTNSSLFGRSVHCYSINGDLCLSASEKIITDFLIVNKIKYKKDQKYSNHIDDIRCKGKTVDWILEKNIFVEFFGLQGKKQYDEKTKEKTAICRDCNIALISIFRRDLNKLNVVFKDFINL